MFCIISPERLHVFMVKDYKDNTSHHELFRWKVRGDIGRSYGQTL